MLQVNAAAKSVHAQVMDPEGKVLREDGDLQLRRSYSDNMWRLMQEAGSQPVQDVVDLGCATGDRGLWHSLLHRMLARLIPHASTRFDDLPSACKHRNAQLRLLHCTCTLREG